YTHPTTAGNKHIPAGGSVGQILRWSANGTAVWSNENNTTYSAYSGTASPGLVPGRVGATTTKYLNETGSWSIPPDTTYSTGTYANIDTSDDKVKVWTGEILKEYFDNYIRTSHAANTVTTTLIGQWNTAYGWGPHSGLYLPLTGGQLTGNLEIK